MIRKIKFVVLYLLFIFISIFFYFNKSLILNYIQNIHSYQKVDNLKSSSYIKSHISWFSYTWLKLWKYDNLNLSILTNNPINYNWYLTYKYLYNFWNKFLLDWYKKNLKNLTWDIDDLKKSIIFYKKSLKLTQPYTSKKYVLNNLYNSNNLLNFLYVYKCDILFFNMLWNLKELFLYLNETNNILKKQLWALNKWDKYKFISKCIDWFKKDSNNNIINIYSNEVFFKKVNIWLLSLLKQYQNDEYLCYKNSKIIETKYKDSINSSLKYFKDFKKTQLDLLLIFQKASITQMVQLCNWKEKIANKQKNKNKQMQKNFNSLKDLLNQENQQKMKKPLSKKNDLHKKYNKLDKGVKNKINNLNKWNKDLIKQIEKIKTSDNYSSLDYLNKLFKTFFWDKKVFIEKKYNNTGK